MASTGQVVHHVDGQESGQGLNPEKSSMVEDPEKAWRDIRRAVGSSRRFHMSFATKIPHDFKFLKIDPNLYPDTDREWLWPRDVEKYSTRLLFLGILPNKRENELLYVDVPIETNSEFFDEPVPWKPVVAMFQGSFMPTYSKEEELLRERKRVGVHGVTSYEISHDKSRIFFPSGGDMYYVDAKNLGRVQHKYSIRTGLWTMLNPNVPKYLIFKNQGVKLDPKMAPSNPDVVAYIMNNDIWVKHVINGDEKRMTFTNKGNKDITKEPISAGVTSYVVQEEFDRYTGYWWQPNTPKDVQRILYEEVDESEVQILHIFTPMSEDSIESYRYPRAGTKNATVQLKLLEFSIAEDGLISDSVIKSLPVRLEELFPWMEYIVRLEWLSSGDGICVQILDRPQLRTALIYIPASLFVTDISSKSANSEEMQGVVTSDVEMKDATENPTEAQKLNGIRVLLEETSDVWINVSDAYHFYKHAPGSNVIQFVWSSERTGHRHLYRMKCDLSKESDSLNCSPSVVTLTAGNWDIMEHNDTKTGLQIWVKEETDQVFFVGLKDSVLESHLYMANPSDPENPTRLTQPGRSHSVSMDEDCTMFVTVSSCIKELYSAKLYKLTEIQQLPSIMVNLLDPEKLIEEYTPPEIFTFQSESGFEMHGMVHKPLNFEEGKKYPTVVYVYGGPRVQMVTNSFKGLRYGRLFTYTLLGYVVVTVDGRGSAHRGIAFEGAVKNKLGQIEVADQVEGLKFAAEKFQCIDLNRVAIHGWSYGGYLSLMSLAQQPDVFKMAICGAPVTNWEMYDTGYTERYMGTPESNPEGYQKGSVVKSAIRFPIQPNRLFLFQGVIDENVHFVHTAHLVNALVRYCRPYHLQIYPGERHGLRSAEGNEHYETIVLMYLQQYL